MRKRQPLWLGICVGACMSLAIGAQAETININLTGVAGNAVISNGFENGDGYRYDMWALFLSPSLFGPVTIAAGDHIVATVTLDSAVLIPPSAIYTVVGLTLLGNRTPGFPVTATSVTTSGSTSLFLDGSLMAAGSGETSVNSAIASGANFSSASFMFDYFTTDFTVDTLDYPLDINSALLRFVQVRPVPLPAGVWLLGSGLGLLLGRKGLRRHPRDTGEDDVQRVL